VIRPAELETLTHCPLCGHDRWRPWREVACREAPEEVFAIVECEACTLRVLNPRPRPEVLGRYYTTDYYSYQPSDVRPRSHVLKCRLWGSLGLLPPRSRSSAVAGVTRALVTGLTGVRAHWLLPPSSPGRRFLDIGCGAGHRLDLARELGWETFGVDMGLDGLKAARWQGHQVAAADAGSLPLAADSFDFVNLSHTLEHTQDPVGVLAECRRLLRPGGAIQIVVPNADSWGSRRYGNNWRALEAPRHLYQFTARTLAQCARQAGLTLQGVSTLHNEWVLQESRALAGEPPPARLPEAVRRRWRLLRGQGDNLCLWCTRP
jgi:SAM-dependent methyltransferase